MALTDKQKKVVRLYVTENGWSFERIYTLVVGTTAENKATLKAWAADQLLTGKFSTVESGVMDERSALEDARDA